MGSRVSTRKDDHSDPAARSPVVVGPNERKRGLRRRGSAGELSSKIKPPQSGSREETFFDSQSWLDSDCEDDFVSIHGDFTHSEDSTPNYQISTPETQQLNKPSSVNTFPDTKSEPSPTDGKKKLADLLQENPDQPGTNSACSSDLTPDRDPKPHKEETAESKQCCLPHLLQCLGFSNRRKKKKSPAH